MTSELSGLARAGLKRRPGAGLARGFKFALLPMLLAAAAYAACPVGNEQAEDCPWAGAARELSASAAAGRPLEPVLAGTVPGVLRQLDADRGSAALQLWGESINFDELARGVIVDERVLAFLSSRAGVQPPKGRLAHAGVEHTYGYLFSVLPTKFGFKRARWVRPDIEEGLGLPRGSVGPAPAEGTLLANVTCLAGGIALKDDPAAHQLLQRVLPSCGAAVRAYALRPVRRGRLTEEVQLPGGRKIVLRTDFAPFRTVSGGNTHLLVYSVFDSALGRAYLVTAFPVAKGFVDKALDPANLGENKPVQTRYNAHVEGLTGSGKAKGLRRVEIIER